MAHPYFLSLALLPLLTCPPASIHRSYKRVKHHCLRLRDFALPCYLRKSKKRFTECLVRVWDDVSSCKRLKDSA
jgi:hypothetical protein